MSINIVVFEDADVDQLYPITTGRAAHEITCASYRLIDWLRLIPGELTSRVRPHLRTIQLCLRERCASWRGYEAPTAKKCSHNKGPNKGTGSIVLVTCHLTFEETTLNSLGDIW